MKRRRLDPEIVRVQRPRERERCDDRERDALHAARSRFSQRRSPRRYQNQVQRMKRRMRMITITITRGMMLTGGTFSGESGHGSASNGNVVVKGLSFTIARGHAPSMYD